MFTFRKLEFYTCNQVYDHHQPLVYEIFLHIHFLTQWILKLLNQTQALRRLFDFWSLLKYLLFIINFSLIILLETLRFS